jgi:NitT/TauT family transport system permease protein
MNRFLGRAFVQLAMAAAVIGFWQWSIWFFAIPPYLLPQPLDVLRALKIGLIDGLFYPHIAATLSATATGYLVGCAFALVTGIIVAEFQSVGRVLHPYIVALQAMPKVALAPLVVVWFGFGMASKVALVAMISFFPVFVNVIAGIRSTNPDLINLYRAFSAGRLSTLINVKLPSAAGAIFAGLQIAVVLALIGAVVAEFVASTAGLGNLIQAAGVNLNVPIMFAAIIILSAIGVISSQLLRALNERVVFWEGGRRSATTDE